LHTNVSEAAVVGYPHEIKGQGLYAFVTLNKGIKKTQNLEKELFEWVKKEIGSFAKPDFIQFTDDLPKTRSGKIMRRILRKISINEHKDLGDTSTLSDPSVVDELVKNRKNSCP
jgi:acetyl-CoA synthetase